MKTVTLLFYPLERLDEDGVELGINFEQLLIKKLYYSSTTSNEDIAKDIDKLQAFQVLHVDSWHIEE